MKFVRNKIFEIGKFSKTISRKRYDKIQFGLRIWTQLVIFYKVSLKKNQTQNFKFFQYPNIHGNWQKMPDKKKFLIFKISI
jgi:hypothetical protein